MKLLSMFLGILIAFLGAVSAISIGTPTTAENATRASVGPRRNGFSDLPSSVGSYNARQPYNVISDYVMANDPESGGDAIIYTREEIYTAMQQGYEALQRTRDEDPAEFVEYGNIQYPSLIYFDEDNLEETHSGRYGFGFNQNPGQDRVVFSQDGVYLGVITRRDSESQPDGGFRWCPPTDGYGRWIAHWIAGPRGWDWTGVPPSGIRGYMPPDNWNIAASQRYQWMQLNPGGMPPVGSTGAQVNSSNPPTVDMTPPDAPFDDDNPLQFPPWDNSTGTLVTYVPSNTSVDGNLTNQFEAADCAFARDHGAKGYHQSCQTRFPGGKSMQVRITISGTGQDTGGWCQGIMDNMHKQCGGHFSLLNGIYSCNKRYPGTATFSKATDPSDPGYGKMFFGIDLHFWMQWPWEQSDADHKCIASSVEIASCGGSRVKSFNGKWCRNIYWRPSPPLVEWSNDMGIA